MEPSTSKATPSEQFTRFKRLRPCPVPRMSRDQGCVSRVEVVPDPRNMAARTQSQATKAHKRDAELIGVPNKGSHALRRFMISAARSSGARSDVLEQITHNARGAIIDVYTAWEWPALCEAVSCLTVEPERLPGRIYDISYDICVSQNANPRQSLRLFGGGGGNRTLLTAIR